MAVVHKEDAAEQARLLAEARLCPGCGEPDCDFDCDGEYDPPAKFDPYEGLGLAAKE